MRSLQLRVDRGAFARRRRRKLRAQLVPFLLRVPTSMDFGGVQTATQDDALPPLMAFLGAIPFAHAGIQRPLEDFRGPSRAPTRRAALAEDECGLQTTRGFFPVKGELDGSQM